MNKSVILPKIPTLPNEPAAAMRGTVVRRQVGATKHGNENRKYDLLSPLPTGMQAHMRLPAVSWQQYINKNETYNYENFNFN